MKVSHELNTKIAVILQEIKGYNDKNTLKEPLRSVQTKKHRRYNTTLRCPWCNDGNHSLHKHQKKGSVDIGFDL